MVPRFALSLFLGTGMLVGVPAFTGQYGHHYCDDCPACTDDGNCGWGHHRMGGPGGQRSGSGPGWAMKEETRDGKIVEVNYLPGMTRDTATVEVALMAGTEKVLARLGPSGYLHQNEMDLREGDTVTVAGYWVSTGQGDEFVVTRITRQNKSVQLRDRRGHPLW